MREKIAGYNSNLIAAGDSDARLEQRLMKDNAAFSALSIDAAVAQMPRLQVYYQNPGTAAEVQLLCLQVKHVHLTHFLSVSKHVLLVGWIILIL